MTVADKVKSFLKKFKANKFCDDCIKELLNIPKRQQVQQATQPLTNTGDYDRNDGTCSKCGEYKKVAWCVQRDRREI